MALNIPPSGFISDNFQVFDREPKGPVARSTTEITFWREEHGPIIRYSADDDSKIWLYTAEFDAAKDSPVRDSMDTVMMAYAALRDRGFLERVKRFKVPPSAIDRMTVLQEFIDRYENLLKAELMRAASHQASRLSGGGND